MQGIGRSAKQMRQSLHMISQKVRYKGDIRDSLLPPLIVRLADVVDADPVKCPRQSIVFSQLYIQPSQHQSQSNSQTA